MSDARLKVPPGPSTALTPTPTTMRSTRRASPVRAEILSRAERARRFGIDCTECFVWAGGEWAPGGEYKKVLRVKNVSGKMQRIKYALPASHYFSMCFPRVVKLPAGMEVTFDIVFRPVCFQRYDDVVTFTSERGTFAVPITARLAKLAVEVPDVVDFDCCPVKESSERSFYVLNSGEVPAAYTWAVEAPFDITPRSGLLMPGKRAQFAVRFAPMQAMKWHSTAVCTFEDGDGDEGGDAGATVCSVRLDGVGKFPFLRANKRELSFGSVEVDGKRVGELEFILENPTRVPAAYKLTRLVSAANDNGAAPNHFTFRMERNQRGAPIESGVVAPMNSMRLFCTFSPLLVGLCSRETFEFTTPCGNKATLMCVGTSSGSFTAVWKKHRNAAPAASTQFGSATAARAVALADIDGDGNLTTEELAEASLAVGLPCTTTATLNFGDVALGSSLRLNTVMDNRSKKATHFQVLADENGVFQFPVSRGMLPMTMQTELVVSFRPTHVGNFYKRVHVLLQDGDPSCIALDLIGTCFESGKTVRPARMKQKHVERFERRRAMGLGRLSPNEINDMVTQLEDEDDREKLALLDTPIPVPGGTTRSGESSRANIALIEQLFAEEGHEVTISCREISFGSTSLRGEAPKRTVQVTNHTHAKVNVQWLVSAHAAGAGAEGKCDNPFSIYPETADIAAGRSVAFRVAYRPTATGALHVATLECVASFKVQRNFRLVHESSFAPPWTLPLRVLGHTFPASSESFLPRVDFKLRQQCVRFPSCHVGDTAYTTVRMDNTGHTPVIFQFKPDTTGTFSVTPTGGMVPSNAFQIFMLSFTPRDATRHAAALECSLNDGASTKSVVLEGIGYLPEVEIVEGEELWFKPTSIGMASVRAMHVRNKSRIPLRFRWEIPAKFAHLLAVRDEASLLSGMESTLVRWRFSPESDGPIKLWAVCHVYSGGDGEEPERVFQKLAVHFHGQGKNNSLVRFEPLQVDFGTALVGSSSTRELTLVNGSNSKLRYELVVRRVDGGDGNGEGGPGLAPLIECTPPIDELQARSSTTVKVKFTPRDVGEYKFEVLWDTASDRRLKAVQAHHELTKAELCMAEAHFHHKPDMHIISHHLKAAAYTMGGLDLIKLFQFLDTDGGGDLCFPEFLKGVRRAHIPKTAVSDAEFAWLFSQIDRNGGGEIDAIEFVNFISGEERELLEPILDDNFSVRSGESALAAEEDGFAFEADKFVGAVGCELLAKAGYPLLSIDSVCTQSGPSPAWLWQRMSLFALNAELMSSPAAGGGATSDRYAINFSPAAPRSAPQVLRLILRNNSALAVDLAVKFPNDLEIEMEPWADAGEPSKQQLVENAVLDAHLFDVAPRQLSLAPGQSAAMRFTYDYINTELADGIHELPVELSVQSSKMKVRTVPLLLRGRTLPTRGRKARPILVAAQPTHVFVAQPIGQTSPPIQSVRVRNASAIFAVDYRLDSANLDAMRDENFGFDVLRCLNPTGRIAAGSDHVLHFVFNPIVEKEYTVRVKVVYASPSRRRGSSGGDGLVDGFGLDLVLTGRGRAGDTPTLADVGALSAEERLDVLGSNRSFLSAERPMQSARTQGEGGASESAATAELSLPPWQPASLSAQCLDLGAFPAGARVSQLVVVRCPDSLPLSLTDSSELTAEGEAEPADVGGVHFEWDRELAHDLGVAVTPWSGTIAPGGKSVCKVSYISTDLAPRLLDAQLKCKVWRSSATPEVVVDTAVLRPGISRLNSTRGSFMTTQGGAGPGPATRGSIEDVPGPDGDWRTITKHQSVTVRGTRSGTARSAALQLARDGKRENQFAGAAILSLKDEIALEERRLAKERTAARDTAIRTARDVVSAVHERARRDIEVAQRCTLWLSVVGDVAAPRDPAEVALQLPDVEPSPHYFPVLENLVPSSVAQTPFGATAKGLDALVNSVVATASVQQKLGALRAQASPFFIELRARYDPSLRVTDLEEGDGAADDASLVSPASDAAHLANSECFALAADVLENTVYNIMCEAVLGETKLHVPPTVVYEKIRAAQ